MARKQNQAASQWYTVDLHLHTPASTDFQQPDATYIDILEKAETRGLDMIAFTDHNTVAGYRKLSDEIQQLELLEKLGRLLPEERTRLDQYRRLMARILVLPGFEFTATFGFHILCIFPPDKPVRELEHLLLTLNIPPEHIDEGSQTVGATSDALTVYRVVNQHGGLVIAAHANSSNGVAMRGFNFGGQTKIAFTQDINLHALEVTDLEQKGPRSTAAFFNGTKPEYPRRMHCVQGSDAHRVTADPLRKKNLSIGDRATDVLMTECTFQALKEVFLGNDFSRTRPHSHADVQAYDFIQSAVEEGSNI
ncbi:MAG: PHP domain-containing protein, partial [Bellilinea sp.]